MPRGSLCPLPELLAGTWKFPAPQPMNLPLWPIPQPRGIRLRHDARYGFADRPFFLSHGL
jgi:hypothetical protein